jgi:hypothetical protein
MAVIETWYNQDLQQPVKVRYLDGSMFSHNGNGNRIGVRVYNDGEPVTLTGTVSGYVVTSDGSTVPCTGSRSGNNASILIPAAAYQPGAIFITIFLTDGTTVTTLASVATNVLTARTGNQVSPGSVVTDWTNTINAAMQAVVDANAANMAVPYEGLTYPVPLGKYTLHDNLLYRCISPIASSEEWTESHWVRVRIADDVADLRSAISGLPKIFTLSSTAGVSRQFQYDFIAGNIYTITNNTSSQISFQTRETKTGATVQDVGNIGVGGSTVFVCKTNAFWFNSWCPSTGNITILETKENEYYYNTLMMGKNLIGSEKGVYYPVYIVPGMSFTMSASDGSVLGNDVILRMYNKNK